LMVNPLIIITLVSVKIMSFFMKFLLDFIVIMNDNIIHQG
jgi:hypothetical protein